MSPAGQTSPWERGASPRATLPRGDWCAQKWYEYLPFEWRPLRSPDIGAASFPSGAPPVGDYDGDGDTDAAGFRPSVGGWYVNGQATEFFGLSGDVPVPGDYDGNGTTAVAIFRPPVGGWYGAGRPTQFLGMSSDVPQPGDYDGDGTTDRVGVVVPGDTEPAVRTNRVTCVDGIPETADPANR